MENRNADRMPPVIRVFLSSTFSDMERERTYFNEELSPKISRICAQRGVSFFSVDLRWGITQEEQINGQVLPICLSEIDKCRPYFIGILGSRYGSVLETVPEQLGNSIPWLRGREGKSITELEMLYAVLEHSEPIANCAFYFRDPALSEEWYGDIEEEVRLTRLKERIRGNADIPGADYDSLEVFGQRVMADILGWLDREFPEPERAGQVRRQWYNGELLRNYMPVPGHQRFLDAYLRESDRSLLFYGDGGRGKTTFLTAWEPEQGKKLLINCGSDDGFTYWPGILRQVVEGIIELGGGVDLLADTEITMLLMQGVHEDGFYFTSRQSMEELRLRFPQWLSKRTATERIYVVINDLNLITDESGRLLSWLPGETVGNVQFLCSTNCPDMVKNAEALNWNCREMPTFPENFSAEFLSRYLSIYGKGLSSRQTALLLSAPSAVYPGQLRVMADFLINCGRFHNLDALIEGLSRAETPYECIYGYYAARGTEQETRTLRCVLGLLRCARVSLNESACYRLASGMTGITAMGWAKVRSVFEQLGVVGGDYWTLRQKELGEFTDRLLTPEEFKRLHVLLGAYMLLQVNEDTGKHFAAVYAGAVLYHFTKGEHRERLLAALSEERVLTALSDLDWRSVRVAWMWLLLHTDTDVPGRILELLKQYADKPQLQQELGSLVADLNLDAIWEQGKTILGRNPVRQLGLDLRGTSRQFNKIYQQLLELHRGRQSRQLLNRVTQVLEQNVAAPGAERCRVLMFKAEAQLALRLHRELLETANEYYLEALRTGSVGEMYRGLSYRVDALHGLSRYEEALAAAETVAGLTLREGDARQYLNMQDIRAHCLYRLGEPDRALEELTWQEQCWRRMGDTRALASIAVTRCNILSYQGKDAQALEVGEAALESFPDTLEFSDARVSLMGNLGVYAMELNRYELAEEYLLKTMELAEKIGNESTLAKARLTLIKIYEKTDRFVPAAKLYDAQLELYWSRREYEQVLSNLNSAVDLLLSNKYAPVARELRQRWKERFDTIPGGSEMFLQGADSSVADGRKIDRLEELLTMAKSDGDPHRIGEAYFALAQAVGSSDLKRMMDCVEQAVWSYREAEEEAAAQKCLEYALTELFDSGRVQDQELYRSALGLIDSESLYRLAKAWEALGSIPEEDRTKADRETVVQLTGELMALVEEIPEIVLSCLLDILKTVVNCCPAEVILALVKALPEAQKEDFLEALEKTMLLTHHADIDRMTKDHASPETEERLEYYEKCIYVMDTLNMRNIANTAGNLALIFRRRGEQEKTLRYHEISRRNYHKQGSVRDELIEAMNLATAYEKFGDAEKAVETLRQALPEATAAGERGMAAAIAGNLASFLTRHKQPNTHEEVMHCFSIEESYFRFSGAQRELAISLLNQVIYLHDKQPIAAWEGKLREVGQIIRQNNFREFEQVLTRLEWMAQKQAQTQPQNLDEQRVREQFEILLEKTGVFRLEELSFDDGMFRGTCPTCKASPLGPQQLQLYLSTDSPNHLVAVFLYHPTETAEGSQEELEKYIRWWNAQESYQLKLYPEDMVLQATCRIMAPDWNALIARFDKYLNLWQVDMLSAAMIGSGMYDLSVYQGMKLQVLTEGQ